MKKASSQILTGFTGFLRAILLIAITYSGIIELYANEPNLASGFQVQTGMNPDQVRLHLGEPENNENVVRWVYHDLGHVVVGANRVADIRLSNKWKDRTPVFDRHFKSDENINKLRYVRIGNKTEELISLAGKPDLIINGEDWYYHNGSYRIEFTENTVSGIETQVSTGLERLDWVRLNFSRTALLIMNITLAFIMFGVALEIRFENFARLFREPRSLFLGVFSQFLALPALTFLLIYFLKPTPSVALGMILVAACPGGNISNFISSMAKGNVALSISLTALATIFAVFMTPLNFAFWGNLYSETANMVIPIRIDFFEILRTVLILLGIPVVAGIWFARQFPVLTHKIIRPIKLISMGIFIVFVILALLGNIGFFKSYIHLIALIVLLHNAIALLSGYITATLGKVSRAERRSLSIETGIQNSGLGLVLIFNPRLFDGLGGMAFIAAWWGIWHIISGLVIAYFWSKKPLKDEILEPLKQEADL